MLAFPQQDQCTVVVCRGRDSLWWWWGGGGNGNTSILHTGKSTGVAVSHWGRLKRTARAVQLFGRLAVLEAHTL